MHGVKELILVDPTQSYVERVRLGPDGRYGAGDVFGTGEVLSLHAIEDIAVPLWEVFGVEPPAATRR